MKPSPYPNTDAAEQDAINTFKSLIDTTHVKDDIRTRDKYPNVDGVIELVNDDLVPVGKFDVQIRKIPDGNVKYSCSVSLVEYSKVSTLPVVLICVDVGNRRAYWRSIAPNMPELVPDQNSFTISFDPSLDTIDNTGTYIRRWRELVEDYQRRITGYPELQREVANKLSVERIPEADKRFFQGFIDRINTLLDHDFIAVKHILLPDVWKLGVGVYGTNENAVSYQMYKIPAGSTAPLLCAVDGLPFDFSNTDPNAFSHHWSSREHMNDPVRAGESFVLDHVKKVVEKREFTVHGIWNCNSVLLSFLDQHGHCLGLQREATDYTVADIAQGLTEYLPGVCSRMAQGIRTNPPGRRIFLDFEMVSQAARQPEFQPLPRSEWNAPFVIYSNFFRLNSLAECIQFLTSRGVSVVHRRARPRSIGPVAGASWIWDGFSEDDERHNVMAILNSSLDEYRAFVEGNGLRFPHSRYLDRDTTIAIVYQSSQGNSSMRGPVLREYFVDNTSRTLPKLLTVYHSDEPNRIVSGKFPIVTIDGCSFKCSSWRESAASYLFQRTPEISMTYIMLCRDLQEHYPIGHIHGQI